MIAGILSILGSSAFGTILGGLFAIFNKKADLETKKLELQHEVAKWTHELSVKDKDLAYAQQEQAAKRDVILIEADSAIEQSRMAAIAGAQAADRLTADEIRAAGKLKWMLIVADVLNRLVRPVLTGVLAGAAIYVNLLLVANLSQAWESYTQIQRYDAALQAFAWLTGQAAACISYWFVSRGASVSPTRK